MKIRMSPDFIKLAEIRNNIKIRMFKIQNKSDLAHRPCVLVFDILYIANMKDKIFETGH